MEVLQQESGTKQDLESCQPPEQELIIGTQEIIGTKKHGILQLPRYFEAPTRDDSTIPQARPQTQDFCAETVRPGDDPLLDLMLH